MKKTAAALLVCVIMAVSFVFTGCSSSSGKITASNSQSASSSYETGSAEKDQMAIMDSATAAGSIASDELSNKIGETASALDSRKVIKTASYRIETKDYNASITTLEEAIAVSGSYIERSSTYGNPENGGANASYTVRVPVAEYSGFKQAMNSVGNVYETSEGGEDITAQYFDTEARLTVLRAQEKRLLEFLASAVTIEDMITIEEKLSAVRYEIEQLTTTVRKYDNLVEHATVNIDLSQTETYTPPKAKTFTDKLGEAFSGSFNSAVDFMQNLLIALIWLLPYVIIIGIIVVIIIVIVKASAKRRRLNPPVQRPMAMPYTMNGNPPPMNANVNSPPPTQQNPDNKNPNQ